MNDRQRSKEMGAQVPAQLRRRLSGIRELAADWGLPLVAAIVAVVGINLILPGQFRSAFAALSAAFYWVPFAALWIAAGSTLISIAMWLVPAIALSVAWALGAGPGVGWLMATMTAGLLAISFYPPAIEWWGVFVTRVATMLLRMSLNHDDRDIDEASDRVRRRLWTASDQARRSGPDRFFSDLDGIRKAAEDLPTDEIGRAHLRHALLDLIDAVHDQASGEETAESDGPAFALDEYLKQLHLYRSRSWSASRWSLTARRLREALRLIRGLESAHLR